MDFSKFDWKFNLFGIPVRVMATFWLVCVFFSPFSSGNDGPWLLGLLGWSAAMLLTFLAHELGHALSMRKLYGGVPQIDLGIGHTQSGAFVFGGLTTARTRDVSFGKHALTSAAGPLAELASVLVFVIILSLFGTRFEISTSLFGIPVLTPLTESFTSIIKSPAALYFVYYFAHGFIWLGIVWGLFNLAPIFPCDGGQILLAVLGKSLGPSGVRLTFGISFILAVAVAAYFLLNGSVFMPLFFGYTAYQNYNLMRGMRG